MSSQLLLNRDKNQLVTITFNRPEVRNAMSLTMQREFLEIVRSLTEDSSVRCLILTGAGENAFCAGGDLLELAELPSEEDGRRLATVMGEALDILEAAHFPTVAAINGYALGGGSEVALACDLRVVDKQVQFGLVQLRLGLTPGWGAGQRLLRLVGYSRALEILLRAEPLNADDLQAAGLATRVVEAGKAYHSAVEFAEHFLQWDMNAVKAVKRVLRYGLSLTGIKAKQAELEEFPPLWAADAHLDAVDAFLSSRK